MYKLKTFYEELGKIVKHYEEIYPNMELVGINLEGLDLSKERTIVTGMLTTDDNYILSFASDEQEVLDYPPYVVEHNPDHTSDQRNPNKL